LGVPASARRRSPTIPTRIIIPGAGVAIGVARVSTFYNRHAVGSHAKRRRRPRARRPVSGDSTFEVEQVRAAAARE
jgi:hypothetical protein